ncbi:hypothetical protein Tco_0465417 [Tanacetum coccineum]
MYFNLLDRYLKNLNKSERAKILLYEQNKTCQSSEIYERWLPEFLIDKKTDNNSIKSTKKADYSAVWVASISLFMDLLGFSTQKWVTARGLHTVLLTLAGRELSKCVIHGLINSVQRLDRRLLIDPYPFTEASKPIIHSIGSDQEGTLYCMISGTPGGTH